MDGVVDAVVAWHPATQQPGVRRVHHDVGGERGDVSAPKAQASVQRRSGQRTDIDYPRLGDAVLEHAVLCGEELVSRRHRLAHVHEGAVGFEEGSLIAFQRCRRFAGLLRPEPLGGQIADAVGKVFHPFHPPILSNARAGMSLASPQSAVAPLAEGATAFPVPASR